LKQPTLLKALSDSTRYEYQDAHDQMKWKRCYGLEDWTFAEDGKMRKRQMSGNDLEINEAGE
jgi:nuclear transport factor 2 (NTF2) superfamily protein